MADNDGNEKVYVKFSPEEGLTIGKNIKHIANFIPEVISRVTVLDDSETIPSVKFKLIFMDSTESDEYTLPLKGIENVNWYNLNPKCLLNPDFPRAKEHLAYLIRAAAQIASSTEKQYVINRLGTHHIEGKHLFRAGDQLIWSPGKKRQTEKSMLYLNLNLTD